ncbi:MAG TPA: lysine 2,3-aminomutase [Bacteroidales bacterium]|nr:MAG: lysine 2,3-aminomutase [Bacteroidetes bacterium GWE2_42_24]OFY28156.1 MAG: lysine 2,3-aminomutase [Bacteroidetes bacterium GWF2_43_11]HAQ64524.1 lysine 2,3-aminomutase [Bacteroidales bacterium]HBZ65539.1 lysine 2,3-aminomutase [Bacteroidales bacterium]
MIYKAFTLSNFKEIPQIGKLPSKVCRDMTTVGTVLPFKSNNYIVDELIDWNHYEDDPIFHLTFPQREMLADKHFELMRKTLDSTTDHEQIKNTANQIRFELNPHPAGQKEHNVPIFNGERLEGIQHKYRETVLFFPSAGQTCHAYCTFCFRWPQFTGLDEFRFAARESENLVSYLRTHLEVTDILFTGGDPMIMNLKTLERYLNPLLENIEATNIQTIRIGTKSLSYWPYKYTTDPEADGLLKLFERITALQINLAIMAHFSHPRELETKVVQEAIRRIRGTGAQIRTQSPILKHINDNPDIWAEMWRKQVNLNCIPYYMFVPRDTGAQHYFALPLIKTWLIWQQAYQMVSGICRTVRGPCMSCTPGKVQLLGRADINNEKVFILRFLQGRNPDWVQRPFFARYDETAIWMNELQPAFDNEFFFENEEIKVFGEHYSDAFPNDFE